MIKKVKPLVTSTSWETRIAASQAIECIIKNLEPNELILFSGKFINIIEK